MLQFPMGIPLIAVIQSQTQSYKDHVTRVSTQIHLKSQVSVTVPLSGMLRQPMKTWFDDNPMASVIPIPARLRPDTSTRDRRGRMIFEASEPDLLIPITRDTDISIQVRGI